MLLQCSLENEIVNAMKKSHSQKKYNILGTKNEKRISVLKLTDIQISKNSTLH